MIPIIFFNVSMLQPFLYERYTHEGKATRLAELALIFIPIYNVALSAKSARRVASPSGIQMCIIKSKLQKMRVSFFRPKKKLLLFLFLNFSFTPHDYSSTRNVHTHTHEITNIPCQLSMS